MQRHVCPGETYGGLTVLVEVAPRTYGCGQKQRCFRVRCRCGNEYENPLPQIVVNRGGCRNCRRRHRLQVGECHAYLTVVETGLPENSVRVRCVCGSELTITAGHLVGGSWKSCGCMRHVRGNKSHNWRGHGEISGSRWASIVRGAQARGHDFTLTREQAWDLFIAQDRRCALSGVLLTMVRRGTASLDRIDSSAGYSIKNVQWVHKDINMMKQDLSQAEFLAWCRRVARHGRARAETGLQTPGLFDRD
jgi:hypothetical protein